MNKLYIKILITLLLLLILIICIVKSEYITLQNIKIGFIIPTSSNNKNYKDIKEFSFFNILINSIKNKLKNNYNYHFYLGYDHDDMFFVNNKQKIIQHFNSLNLKNSTISMILMNEQKGDLSSIWSNLADIAIKDDCEYLYQIGDDINIITDQWEEEFINKLKSQNNIGVVGPTDTNNTSILTQSFVHKTHLRLFNRYYPTELKNWFVDDWITNVYKPNYYYMFNNIFVKNSGGDARYNVIENRDLYLNVLEKSKECLKAKYQL